MTLKPYECEHCHEIFDEEEHFKSHIDKFMIRKNFMNVSEHCHEIFDEEERFKSHME